MSFKRVGSIKRCSNQLNQSQFPTRESLPHTIKHVLDLAEEGRILKQFEYAWAPLWISIILVLVFPLTIVGLICLALMLSAYSDYTVNDTAAYKSKVQKVHYILMISLLFIFIAVSVFSVLSFMCYFQSMNLNSLKNLLPFSCRSGSVVEVQLTTSPLAYETEKRLQIKNNASSSVSVTSITTKQSQANRKVPSTTSLAYATRKPSQKNIIVSESVTNPQLSSAIDEDKKPSLESTYGTHSENTANVDDTTIPESIAVTVAGNLINKYESTAQEQHTSFRPNAVSVTVSTTELVGGGSSEVSPAEESNEVADT